MWTKRNSWPSDRPLVVCRRAKSGRMIFHRLDRSVFPVFLGMPKNPRVTSENPLDAHLGPHTSTCGAGQAHHKCMTVPIFPLKYPPSAAFYTSHRLWCGPVQPSAPPVLHQCCTKVLDLAFPSAAICPLTGMRPSFGWRGLKLRTNSLDGR